MRKLIVLLLVGCGGYPNETPEGLRCDRDWSWCVTVDGGIVGAP